MEESKEEKSLSLSLPSPTLIDAARQGKLDLPRHSSPTSEAELVLQQQPSFFLRAFYRERVKVESISSSVSPLTSVTPEADPRATLLY